MPITVKCQLLLSVVLLNFSTSSYRPVLNAKINYHPVLN
jgi:hypothetical protein